MNLSESRKVPAHSSIPSPTERRRDRRSRSPTVRLHRGFRDLDFGFGILSFAARLVRGGSQVHRSCRLTSSATLAMGSCRGRRAAVTPGAPWKLILGHARAERLRYVEITTDPENVASRRIIEANGGVLVERFQRPVQYGGTDSLRFRIAL